jgi:hypothetical protein
MPRRAVFTSWFRASKSHFIIPCSYLTFSNVNHKATNKDKNIRKKCFDNTFLHINFIIQSLTTPFNPR